MRLSLLLPLIATAVQAQSPLTTAETDALLEKVAARRGTGISAEFREIRTVPLLTRPIIEEGTLCFRPPASFRKEVRTPTRSVSISDGSTLWLVFPEEGEVERYPMAKNRPLRDAMEALAAAVSLADLKRLFVVEALSLQDGFRLVLEPRKSGLRRALLRIIVELDDAAALRHIHMQSADGGTSRITILAEQPLAGRGDLFSPPPGLRVVSPFGE
jgi:outer membrane lipoprotein-sorting protein